MHTPHRHHSPARRGHPLRAAVLTLVLVLVTAFLPSSSADAEPGDAGPEQSTTGADAGTAPGQRVITLVTGDVVGWQRTSAGTESAWIVEPAAGSEAESAQVYTTDGEAHVVPAEAVPYLRSGRLDENLFNISHLVRQGLDDQDSSTLPLLMEAAGGPSANRAPATPTGARTVRELDSIKTRSVLADKDRMRSMWEAVRGRTAAREDAADARLAGTGRLWLNERVYANLDESVPQIGAPQAWAEGYDGTGIQVAVLDSGWDPAHPDLEGLVLESRNFTQEEDPEGSTGLDRNGHGTHVAATVAGSGAAAEADRRGVAPGAELIIGKVLDGTGAGWSDEIIAGMEWAAGTGAEVVNMSLGTTGASDGQDPFSQAVNTLTESTGTLFVVSAGNSGPDETTIVAPGAADLALTVGAVDKQDETASFSSRGPRLSDGAIKPEVVAPGVGIVAARAAGTSLGNPIDDHYTALNGTSMASPHVAGAAAIVAQQHPGWDAATIKDHLVATSVALDAPVTFRGGGRIDVAAAVGSPLSVSPAVVSLGAVDHDAAPVTRTLTYSNTSDSPLDLDLAVDVASTGADADGRAEVTLDRDRVRVPAEGEATVQATLAPTATVPGGYAGQVVAQVDGAAAPQLSTTLSVVVEGPQREITAQLTDRHGEPASGTVDLWSADTGEYTRLHVRDGVAGVQLPDGLYSAVTTIDTPATAADPAQSRTFAADPELRITADRDLAHDARRADQITVDTPRPADVTGFHAFAHRTVGDRSLRIQLGGGVGNEKAFVIPSPQAETGDFSFATEWQLVQPLLTVRPMKRGVESALPSPELASLGAPYVGNTTLDLVDAGHGTEADYEQVEASGKVVLATRSDASLRSQADAARAAGAAVLLVANDELGRWTEQAGRQDLPVYRLTSPAGEVLRDELAAGGGVGLNLVGIRDASYNYELVFAHESRIPDEVSYDVDAKDLAVVRSDYRENSSRMSRQEGWVPVIDGIGVGNISGIRRNGPVQRTEYVSTEDVSWQRMAQPHGEFPSYYWTWSPERRYAAGEEAEQLWWGPLVHPGVVDGYSAPEMGSPVARFHDAIRVSMPHYSYGAGLWCTIYNQFGDTSELTLRSNGEVLGRSSWSDGQFSVPAAEADYELQLDVDNGAGNWTDTSVRTRSIWGFSSQRTTDERTVLPLVQLDYQLTAADEYNTVRAGSSHPLEITAGYQPGADGPGDFEVTAEVSHDDGDTWVEIPVRPFRDGFLGKVPAGPAEGYASVRVRATDADDNSLLQQIDRAWETGQQGS